MPQVTLEVDHRRIFVFYHLSLYLLYNINLTYAKVPPEET